MATVNSTVNHILVQASASSPSDFSTAVYLNAQALGPSTGNDTTVVFLGATILIRADRAADGTARSVGATENAEDSVMIYYDLIFPECITYGSTGSPRYMTDKTEVASGSEARNARWEYPKHEYTILLENLPAPEVSEVMNLWHVCSGPHAGFLFLDPMDHTSANTTDALSGTTVSPTDQLVGTAVGSISDYAIYKYYQSGAREKRRRILYPQEGSLRIAVDGFECFNWTYSNSTNMLTFTLALGSTTDTLTKTGEVITGHDWSSLQVGDLLYIDGWSNAAYNFPEGGDPVRVRSVTAANLVLEKFDGSDYGLANFTGESITFKSALPPSGSEITSGYYFYTPVRFGDDDVMESEITSGGRDSVIATFSSITLVEVQE